MIIVQFWCILQMVTWKKWSSSALQRWIAHLNASKSCFNVTANLYTFRSKFFRKTIKVQSGPMPGATRGLGSFLILPASAHSHTPTLKLICSLFNIPSKSMIQNIIDQSEKCVCGRIISISESQKRTKTPRRSGHWARLYISISKMNTIHFCTGKRCVDK